MKTPVPLLAASLLAVSLGLAACNAPAPQTSAPPAPGSVAVTPPGFQLPEGTDCSAKIARYRAVQDNDLSMGHVVQSVYNQIKRETDAARRCAQPAATLTPSRWSLLHKGATVIRPVFERKRSADNRRQSLAPALHRCLPDRAQCACARTRPRGRAPGTPRSAP